MNKPDKDPATLDDKVPAENTARQDKQAGAKKTGGAAGAAQAKGWPFAPGSQLGQQVAKPWTPKPAYRFNQR